MTRREWIAIAGLAPLAGCGRKSFVRSFDPSKEEHGNPGRGFYVQRAAESPGDLTDLRARGTSLVLLTLDLKNYRNRPLDEAKLSVLEEAMREIRAAGLKVIFRAAYGFTDADYRVDPADLKLIRGHIAVISRLLSSHAPWVFAVQAGMLGPWGEWHGSVHGDPPSLESRLAVAETWLEHLPENVFLQLRRPVFLRDMNLDFNRCGWHNDALLAMPDDMGTYHSPGWDRARELKWCGDHLPAVPFGGETVPLSESTPPGQVLMELQTLRACYLNSGYHQGTLEHWRRSLIDGESLYDIVKRRLGYRMTVVKVELEGTRGRLTLRNDGFAAPLHPRMVSFAWYDRSTRTVLGEPILEQIDARKWLPGTGGIDLPFALMPPPSVSRPLVLAVRLADVERAITEDGRHSIRLAGGGLGFDGASGWNLLDSVTHDQRKNSGA